MAPVALLKLGPVQAKLLAGVSAASHIWRRLRSYRIRARAVGLAIVSIVFVVSGGHLLFLPLVFLPFGPFGLGHRRRQIERRCALAEMSRRSAYRYRLFNSDGQEDDHAA